MEDRYNVECCDFIHAHEEIVEKEQEIKEAYFAYYTERQKYRERID